MRDADGLDRTELTELTEPKRGVIADAGLKDDVAVDGDDVVDVDNEWEG